MKFLDIFSLLILPCVVVVLGYLAVAHFHFISKRRVDTTSKTPDNKLPSGRT